MSNYAILRTAKLKSWGNIGGSLGHTYRQSGMAPNADPKRLGKNRVLVGTPGDGASDIRKRIDSLGKKTRSNAVLVVEHMLTMSPEWAVGKSKKQIDYWVKENVKWLQNRYGKDNVAHAVLHLDETTPHIAAFVVPEVNGSLNARELFGGREKMSELQSSYADAMKPMGLQRGLEGSKARHQTVKNFYATVNQVEASSKEQFRKISKSTPYPEPSIRSVVSKSQREGERAEWEKKDQGRKATLVKTAGKAITSALMLKREVDMLKDENSALTAENEHLKQRLAGAYEELALPKDEISKLRKLDISAVAERLGYFDAVQKGENSIDLVKRINGFDYGQAVAWLYDEFGAAGAVQAVRSNLEINPPTRPFTKSENAIKRSIATQLSALGCDKFRVSLISNDNSSAPYIPGKSGDGEYFYSRNDIQNLIPYFRYENNVGGRHVFITPMDDHAYYVLLDDLRISPEKLEEKGFEPCLVQKTSWNSTQAVLKVPKTDVIRDDVLKVFNELNKEMGDTSISGLRHPMRLAGFRNMKPKHEREGQYPFVSVVSAVNRYCRQTWNLIKQKSRPDQVDQDTILKKPERQTRQPKM